MKRQKSKFLNFLFALIPGASQMYLGFIKRGVSFMTAAIAIIFVSSVFDSTLLLLLCVIEAFSFFDGINRNAATPEEFAQLTDDYFFEDFTEAGKKYDIAKLNVNVKRAAGIAAVILGAWLLITNVSRAVLRFFDLSNVYWNLYDNMRYYLPRLALSALLIYAGYALIKGKRMEIAAQTVNETDNEGNDDEQ